jgi:hypothetical protein
MKKDDIKTSRASQTRSKTERPKVWTPPSSLDAPPAPDGFRHRWIRSESSRADEFPDSDYPVVHDGKFKGIIGVGGLLLARIPEELAKQRTDYFRRQTEGQTEAVDNDLLKEQHKSMPINVDRQSRVTFGGTKKS